MNKLTRLGAIILTLGLSFAVIAVVRGGSTRLGTYFLNIRSHKWGTIDDFWVPRDIILKIDAPVSVNVKLSDPSNVAILNVVNATDSYKLHLKKRGIYTLSIYNPSNSTINVKADYTFYNLEADIIQTSTILVISGVAIIVVQRLYSMFKYKQSSKRQTTRKHKHTTK